MAIPVLVGGRYHRDTGSVLIALTFSMVTDAELNLLNVAGVTYDALAQRFETTRSAVSGRINRYRRRKLLPPMKEQRAEAKSTQTRSQRWAKVSDSGVIPCATAEPRKAEAIVVDGWPDRQHCCWPIGTPGEGSFHFCEASVARAGAPYCAEHEARSRTTVVQPDEANAARRRYQNSQKGRLTSPALAAWE